MKTNDSKTKDPIIKDSLAKKLTIKIAILMISVLLVLLVGAFAVVANIIGEEAYTYNRAAAYTVCDLVVYQANEKNQPVDMRMYDDIRLYDQYFCLWGRVDYIDTYTLRDNDTRITHLDFSVKEGSGYQENALDELIGKEVSITPSETEKKLWSEKDKSYYSLKSFFKGEVTALAVSHDGYGNKVVVEAGVSFKELLKLTVERFMIVVYVLIGVFILMTIIMYSLIRGSVFLPAKRISDSMADFIKNGQKSDVRLDESGSDEFAMIASSFNKMADNIDNYMQNIKALNSEQERQEVELDIASKIQQGLLAPGEFHSGNCEVYGMMTPAKNVGGDFYDYLHLDNGRIMLTIADVSGKGMAASMFMAVTLVLMRQYARMNYSPAEILRSVNGILSEHNPNMLFTTAFIGLYDPETQEMTYSNAGHNIPYIIRDIPEPLDGARNIVLGLYENEQYTQTTTKMDPGDIIFLYTDGVTEAVNEDRQFYGDERLKDTLNSFRPSHEENLVEYVNRSVHEFVKDSEQHDDLTMLSLTIKNRTVLELAPEESEFSKIRQVILDNQLPRELQLSLCVAAEEIFVNICSYAFEGVEPSKTGKVSFAFEYFDRIRMRFEDDGIPYDPTEDVPVDVDYDPDSQMGGLGKLIAFTIADSVVYEYTDEKNKLTITKYLKGGNV